MTATPVFIGLVIQPRIKERGKMAKGIQIESVLFCESFQESQQDLLLASHWPDSVTWPFLPARNSGNSTTVEERLVRTGAGQVLGKSIRSFSHRAHKEADFNRIITRKMKVQLLAEIRTLKEWNKIL